MRRNNRVNQGRKHQIIFFRHSMNRLWRALSVLAFMLFAAWWFAPYIPIFTPPNDQPLLYGAEIIVVLIVYILLVRKSAHIQARNDFVRIKVHLFSVKIPYEYVKTLRTTEFSKVHKYSDLSWTEKRFLRPYFGTTVVVLFLKEYPQSLGLLKILLPSYIFLPRDTGFLFLIDDWMGFSAEFDSRLANSRDYMRTEEVLKYEEKEKGGLFNLFGE